MSGIINVYKEAGYTSFDVCARLRGILKTRKIGHTGTLDPDATGVLPVCIGKATKLCDLLTDKDKEYECVMLLGVTSDTLDTSGTIIDEHPVECSEIDVKQAVNSFIGEIDQIPPMYSALKVNGKKLYELARAGQVIEREARRVTIHSIDIINIDLPRVTMKVHCSKGTYIRSLCDDIGRKLGCGACMEKLIRTRVSVFDIEHAHTLDEIQQMVDAKTINEIMVSVDEVFDYPHVRVEEDGIVAATNGGILKTNICSIISNSKEIAYNDIGELPEGTHILLYLPDGRFIGVFHVQGDEFKLDKMFLE